jgi:murein DD-endopeptidase MepM/ murein hydrolase activator NlpD
MALGACSAPPSAPSSGPTFVLPSSTSAPAAASPGSVPPSSAAPTSEPPATATAKKAATYAFPVIGRNSYAHTHHDYPATDIITNCGNKVVAATTGTILAVTRKDIWKPAVNAGATRGGLSISILGDDGVRYYGSHMSAIDPKITPGAHVTTGQTLGKIGKSGDTTTCHLHFGISPPCSKVGDWWIQRGVLYPWPYLDAWRKGTAKSAVAAVAAWKAQHGCPTKPLVDP